MRCVDCKCFIDRRSKRCHSCNIKHHHKLGILNFKGKNNPNYKNGLPKCIDCGKKLTAYNIERCRKCYLKFSKTNKYRDKLSKFCLKQKRAKGKDNPCYGLKGRNHPAYKNGGKFYCIDCGKRKSDYRSKRCGKCYGLWRSKNIRGRNHSHFGKTMAQPKYIKYNNIWFRSSWEANFAKWCDLSGIKWEYESKTFDLGTTTYTPDFYLPEFDNYVEIKGWLRKDAQEKLIRFKEYYSKIYLEIFNKDKLKEIGII